MRITLLSARTLRSLAYAFVLRDHSGIDISILEYGTGSLPTREFPPATDPSWDGLPEGVRGDWLASYVQLAETAPLVRFADALNTPPVRSALVDTQPDLVLYGGASGNLVGDELLSVAPFLHMHPGSLPQFRGSTTIYWSLLGQQPVTVSAIYLSPKIDQGLLVASREFGPPSRYSDIDGLYDCGIRASLLDDLLTNHTSPPVGFSQASGGTDYFVIHPVLKNLAIERLGTSTVSAR